jgi:predicted MPP superfamily phosphohydrolase
MKLLNLSDIHLEFHRSYDYEFKVEPTEIPDVIILAGDISCGTGAVPFIEELSIQFPDTHIFYVTGNHEYYHYHIDEVDTDIFKALQEKNLSNVTFLKNGESKVLNGVLFVGGTLWTDFDNNDSISMDAARWSMNDYFVIRGNSPEKVYQLHKACLKNICEVLEQSKEQKKVVIGHHLPSKKSIAPMFQDSDLNGAYASDLEWVMEKYEPVLFVHGHTHFSFDYMIGKTRVYCNPYGYYSHSLNSDFNFNLIEI